VILKICIYGFIFFLC
jgi:hypothetical protein